eukprot:15662289-Heterocapsa_arctica.AAC.1
MPLHISELLEDQRLLTLPAHVAILVELAVELAELTLLWPLVPPHFHRHLLRLRLLDAAVVVGAPDG